MTDDHLPTRHDVDSRGTDPAGGHGGSGGHGIDWDERYSVDEQLWSGEPNGSLVAEVAGLEPGTALDVGCGEGADAIWLAGLGWRVTAIDVADVALERARHAARQAGVEVEWQRTGLLDAVFPPHGFDLVSAQYPALLHTGTQGAERALLAAVAPGGHLVVVHHADIDEEVAKAHGFDPADYVSVADVSALLDDD